MSLPPPIDWQVGGLGPGPDVSPERRVTRDNWRLYPYSRWAFQHTRELVPSRGLPRADAPRALPVRPVDLSKLIFSGDGGERIGWLDFLASVYTDALVVVHRGVIVHEYYANGMAPDAPHMLFSVTKSIVGLVAERLIAAGTLDPQVTVVDLVPELAPSAFATASLRHLLDMTDGVAFDENYADPQADVHLYSAAYWTPAAGHDGVLGALARLIRRTGDAGSVFRYRTPVADALGVMLRRATGWRLADLVAEHVWAPAGCGDDAHMLVDTAGMEIAGTGLNATARDMARVAAWLLEEEQRPLLRTVLAGGDRALYEASGHPTRPGGSYRSLWWIDHGTPPTLAANGVYGQRLWLDPDNDLAVIGMGSHPVAGNSFTDPLHRPAFAALRAALTGGTP